MSDKTKTQEMFEDAETPPEHIVVGDKTAETDESDKTEAQKFEGKFWGNESETEEEPTETQETSGEEAPEEEDGVAQRAKFFQTQYQDYDALLKQADPNLRDKLRSQLKAQRKGEVTEPQPKPTTNGSGEEEIDLYSNPQKLVDMIRNVVAEETAQTVRKVQDQSQREAQWNSEIQTANKAIDQIRSAYKTELKVDDNAWQGIEQQAWNGVLEVFGLSDNNDLNDFIGDVGAPTKVARVFQKNLENAALKSAYLNKVTQSTAEVAGKIKAATQVAQPSSKASPAPKDKSKAKKILESIKLANADPSAKSELFGR